MGLPTCAVLNFVALCASLAFTTGSANTVHPHTTHGTLVLGVDDFDISLIYLV
jgi:hypothetical protein